MFPDSKKIVGLSQRWFWTQKKYVERLDHVSELRKIFETVWMWFSDSKKVLRLFWSCFRAQKNSGTLEMLLLDPEKNIWTLAIMFLNSEKYSEPLLPCLQDQTVTARVKVVGRTNSTGERKVTTCRSLLIASSHPSHLFQSGECIVQKFRNLRQFPIFLFKITWTFFTSLLVRSTDHISAIKIPLYHWPCCSRTVPWVILLLLNNVT